MINENIPLPKESTLGHSHILTSNGVRYDVYRLIQHSENIEPIRRNIAVFDSQVSEPCWYGTDSTKISPREVIEAVCSKNGEYTIAIEHYPQYAEHIAQIRDAETQYPILIREDDFILDGMHRIAQMFISGR